jgi:hypothetical protein
MVQLTRAALAVLALTTAAHAVDFSDPRAVVEAVYEPYLADEFNWADYDQAPLRSDDLNALYARDAAEFPDEIGRLDFDPFVNGQDYLITGFSVGEPAITGDAAVVEVRFANMDMPMTMAIDLGREADGEWKIEDVRSLEGEIQYSLREILEADRPY